MMDMKKLIQPKGLLIISLLSIYRPCIENSLKGSSQIFTCQFSRDFWDDRSTEQPQGPGSDHRRRHGSLKCVNWYRNKTWERELFVIYPILGSRSHGAVPKYSGWDLRYLRYWDLGDSHLLWQMYATSCFRKIIISKSGTRRVGRDGLIKRQF